MDPQWTTAGRRFVPSHLNPGTSRSSFAKPLLESARASSSGAGTAPSRPTGFGTPAPASSAKTGTVAKDDDLPPTESITITRVSPSGIPAAPSTPRRRASATSSAAAAGPEGYSVVVFGFPPGMTQAVLQHFARFGEIVENSPHSGDSPSTTMIRRPAAIECGRNWLRLAYRTRAGAQRALAENGHVMPGQYVVGCVPGTPSSDSSAADASMLLPSATNSLLADSSEVSILPDVTFDDDTPALVQEAAAAATDSLASPVPTYTAGSAEETSLSSPHSNRLVKPAPALLFRPQYSSQSADIAPLAVPERQRETPKSWTGWTVQKVREAVFGWDDL